MKRHNLSPPPVSSIRKTLPPHSPEYYRKHTLSSIHQRKCKDGFGLSEFYPEIFQKGLRLNSPDNFPIENSASDKRERYTSAPPNPPGGRGEQIAVHSPDYAGKTTPDNSGYPEKTRRIPEIAVRRDDGLSSNAERRNRA